MFTSISGSDNSEVLAGRVVHIGAVQFCGVLVYNTRVCLINVSSKRLCLVRIEKLLSYMLYDSGEINKRSFCDRTVKSRIFKSNVDCHFLVEGDFNVDFGRERVHNALLKSFCEDLNLLPVIDRSICDVDYTII